MGADPSVLVVSARLTWDPDATSGKPFGDGRMTSTGTFQKYFEPEELKQWVEAVLDEKAVTAAPGILYVFRDPAAAQQLLAELEGVRSAKARDRRPAVRTAVRAAQTR